MITERYFQGVYRLEHGHLDAFFLTFFMTVKIAVRV